MVLMFSQCWPLTLGIVVKVKMWSGQARVGEKASPSCSSRPRALAAEQGTINTAVFERWAFRRSASVIVSEVSGPVDEHQDTAGSTTYPTGRTSDHTTTTTSLVSPPSTMAEKDAPTMRALRWHGNRDIRLDHIPHPPLRPGWVKIKNGWAGVCGSDLHEYLVGPKNAPTAPHAVTGEQLPTIIGHEFSGRIVEVHDRVPAELGLEAGMKCAVFPVITCRECLWCEKQLWVRTG